MFETFQARNCGKVLPLASGCQEKITGTAGRREIIRHADSRALDRPAFSLFLFPRLGYRLLAVQQNCASLARSVERPFSGPIASHQSSAREDERLWLPADSRAGKQRSRKDL